MNIVQRLPFRNWQLNQISQIFEKQQVDWTGLANQICCEAAASLGLQHLPPSDGQKAPDLQAAGYFQHSGLHSCEWKGRGGGRGVQSVSIGGWKESFFFFFFGST